MWNGQFFLILGSKFLILVLAFANNSCYPAPESASCHLHDGAARMNLSFLPMPAKRNLAWPFLTILVAIAIVLVALPNEWKKNLPPFFRVPQLHLGLDLAGGTQLDFRISEEELQTQLAALKKQIADLERTNPDSDELGLLRLQEQSLVEQQRNLSEAIRSVIERRINGLGVSESIITPSQVGNEHHLLVECPGLIDVQECIAVVGKTIQLEFKEEFTEATEDYTKGVRARAELAYARITQSGASLIDIGQDASAVLGTVYQERQLFYKDQLPKGLEDVWNDPVGKIVRREGSVTSEVPDEQGKVQTEEVRGIFFTEVVAPATATGRIIIDANKAFAALAKTESGATYNEQTAKRTLDASFDTQVAAALRQMKPGDLQSVKTTAGAQVLFLRELEKGIEEIKASHVLVAYKGASNAEATVTRTKEEANARATALRDRLTKGEDFVALARTESDGPSKSEGGSLGTFGKGTMVPSFEAAAFALTKVGDITEIIETQFGFHIIRLDATAVTSPDKAVFDELRLQGADVAKADSLIERLRKGEVTIIEPAITVRLVFFSFQPTGWKDTELDGKHFRSASVTLDPVSNVPVVQIIFDAEGAKLFQELTKKNVGKQLAIFVGGELVSAPVVQQEITGGTAVITGSANVEEAQTLALDLNTGAIPAPIHLVGQYTVEPTLGAQALQTSVKAGLIGIVLLMLYMIVMYRLLGVVANIALLIYAAMLIALMKLPLFLVSDTYIVLTLAGMAGVILSLGMAVDANVLIYERLKEELRKGKLLKTAVESSYIHAWPAIRDGNVSTLITCAILFLIGTSIVRGFAITLGLGVLLSMFTAIVCTRYILRRVAVSKFAERTELFGVKRGSSET